MIKNKSLLSLIFLLLVVGFISTALGQDCNPKDSPDPKTAPYKYVCYLRKFNSRGNAYTSTAFLIAPRVLLTNAHNVYNGDRFDIAPAHHGQGTVLTAGDPRLTYDMVSIKRNKNNTFYSDDFIIREARRRRKNLLHLDYAIIVLPDNTLYNKLGGCLEIAICDDVAKVGDNLSFIGYPGGITKYNPTLLQKTNTGMLTGYYEDNNMISYHLGTEKGASGSPIIITKDGIPKAIGIHGYGSDCNNSAIKISKEVIANIRSWSASAGL